MRTSILALCLMILASTTAMGSLVVHDEAPGIIAHDQDNVLDSNGLVWYSGDFRWDRNHWYDPPVPVEEIKFWSLRAFVTFNEECWHYGGSEWWNLGTWPDLPASVGGKADYQPSAAISPNPTADLCRVAFRVMSTGEVSAKVLDISGRVVRQLLDGPLPAGDYRLEWDGLDDHGRELPAGFYLTRIEQGEGVTSGRIVLSR